MKLEEQVCSLPLAQRLKELGVKQESVFYWNRYQDHRTQEHKVLLFDRKQSSGENWSALTVAEVLEKLGKFREEITYGSYHWGSNCYNWYHKEVDEYVFDDNHGDGSGTDADNLSAILIYLLENNLISITKTP